MKSKERRFSSITFLFFFLLLCWGYIVAFSKVLTIYQIYHNWIYYPFHHSPLSPDPQSLLYFFLSIFSSILFNIPWYQNDGLVAFFFILVHKTIMSFKWWDEIGYKLYLKAFSLLWLHIILLFLSLKNTPLIYSGNNIFRMQ
jgi:hypothetical protein